MCPGPHDGPDGFSCKARADREPPTEPFCRCEDIWRNAFGRVGKDVASTTDAGLHFVEQQQNPVEITETTECMKIAGRQWADTALSLDRLNENAGGFLGDSFFDRKQIAEAHLVKPIGTWFEALQILLLTSGRQRTQCPAVESAFERDYPVALWRAAAVVGP